MNVKLTTLMKQAAFMKGLPVTLWVLRALYNQAQQDLQSAHVALCDAGVRNREEIDHREQQKQLDRREREDRARAKRKAAGTIAAGDAVDRINEGFKVYPAEEPAKRQGSGHPRPSVIERYFENVIMNKAVPPVPAASVMRGLIADYRGQYFGTYKEKFPLPDIKVWQLHRRMNGYNSTGADVDRNFGTVVEDMRAAALAERGAVTSDQPTAKS